VATRVLRPIDHEDRLSMVEHLDELRSRLIICLIVLVIAFIGCFIENHALIGVLNRALPTNSAVAGEQGLAALPKEATELRQGLGKIYLGAHALAQSSGLAAGDRAAAAQIALGAQQAARALPAHVTAKEKPITIGVGEPFMTTLWVCAYFALLFSLPVLLYQLYAFVLPALSSNERRAAVPVMLAAPVLFVIGAVFAYFVVLPPAVHFLQGYNSSEFNILVGANTYYKFEILTMLGIALAFQLPLGLLGLQSVGVINGSTLTRHWRYAVVIIAVIAAAMPGADPVTTALETAPLVVLFLASIVLLKFADRRAAKRAVAEGDDAPFAYVEADPEPAPPMHDDIDSL
jgi:sec-independent protein translocase protein TatC